MSKTTPVYGLPYLEPTDRARAIPATSKQLAERIETTLLAQPNRPHPLDSDRASILARLAALEASSLRQRPGMAGQQSYVPASSSRLYTMGDLVLLTVDLYRGSGVGVDNCLRIPSEYGPPSTVTFAGIASQGGSATPVTLVASTNGIVKCWTNSTANKSLSFNIFWKRGA